MATLVVGGVTVAVARDGAKEQSTPLRDMQRMQDGTLRAVVVGGGTKRSWSITTKIVDSASAATLRTALVTTSLPVSCSGDLLGGSVNCIPTLVSYDPVSVGGVLCRVVVFTLDEV